jgi:hypothetical protein
MIVHGGPSVPSRRWPRRLWAPGALLGLLAIGYALAGAVGSARNAARSADIT